MSKHIFEETKKAAESGDSEAMMLLATMYENGNHVKENQKLAFQWYEKAAKAGEPDAMLYLSTLYELGDGVKQSDAKAAYWFAEYEKIMDEGDFDEDFDH